MPRVLGRSGPFLTQILRVTLGVLVTLLTTAAIAGAQPLEPFSFSARALHPGIGPRVSGSVSIAVYTQMRTALAGRVLDPDARPVAGADVMVVRGNQVVATAKTRADGGFGPLTLAAGEYEIVASAPGLRSPSTPAVVKAGAETSIDLKLAVTAIHESIVVSATQVEQPLTRATDSVTVITRAEIERKQIETVPEALRAVPGLSVVASGGRGALTSLFPRGGESDYTLVLVDGVAQNSFGGFVDFAHFGTGEVERIEVVRGPQSALYGGGAIGAIVQIISANGGPARAAAAYEGGGNGTHRGTASVAGSRQAWRWGLSIEGLMTDGDTRQLSNGTRVANDDYERATGSASLGWSDNRGRQVRVDARAGRTERGFPGPFGSDPLGLYQGIDLVSRGVNDFTSLAGTGAFRTGTLTHRGRVSWSGAESDSITPFGPFDDRTGRTTARYQLDTAVRRIDLSAGWEYVHEDAESTFVTGEEGQGVPVRRSVSGWFVEARPNLGRRAFLNVGARIERIEREALEADPLSFSPRPALPEDVVWSVNPKVSVAWFVNQMEGDTWTKVRAGAGTGIKPPTAFDIAFTNNPGLKPERSRSLDVGIEHAMAGSTLVADATFFENHYDDLIVTVSEAFAGSSRYRTDNIANAQSRGLEVGARWHPIEAVAIRAAWTWLDTDILGVDGAASEAPLPYQVGDDLIRRPSHQVSFEAGWSYTRGSAFVLLNGRGTVRDIEPNFAAEVFDNPGFVTVAVGGALRLTRNVEVFTRVTNLFDREYEEAYGFPALGRMGMIGLRVTGHR